MSKLTIGMIISTFGILIVCLTIMNILPGSEGNLKVVYVGLGWVCIIAGTVIRYKDLKTKR
ncbi:MAG: hypothetical protein RR595_05525 [Lysinibacillus sp.]